MARGFLNVGLAVSVALLCATLLGGCRDGPPPAYTTEEVLYHDMVIKTPVPGCRGWDTYASDYELQPLLRASRDHNLDAAIANLNQAFR